MKVHDVKRTVSVFINSGKYDGPHEESDNIICDFQKNKILKIMITEKIDQNQSKIIFLTEMDPNMFEYVEDKFPSEFDGWLYTLMIQVCDVNDIEMVKDFEVMEDKNRYSQNGLVEDYLWCRCQRKPSLHSGISVFTINTYVVEELKDDNELMNMKEFKIEDFVCGEDMNIQENDVILLGQNNDFQYSGSVKKIVSQNGEIESIIVTNVAKMFPPIHLEVDVNCSKLSEEMDHRLINLEMKEKNSYMIW